jgi:hypothetical protein
MSFCKLCGAEIKPGKNFCSSCGTPVDKPGMTPSSSAPAPDVPLSPPPASPSQLSAPVPPLASPTPALSIDKIVIAGVIGVAVIAMIIFIGLPMLNTGGTNSPSPAPVSTLPRTPATNAIYTTLPKTATTAAIATNPVYQTVYIRNEPYTQVFSANKEFDNNEGEVFPINLEQPPMIVQFELTPKTVSTQKLVDIGTANERYITANYASPTSRFDLKVINADTGSVETTMVYQANYNGMLKQEYTVRTPGNYRIQMSGNDVSAHVAVLTK